MAADLGAAPRTKLRVQLCGDAHLSNFGIYRSPERSLVFDLNDFDETLPGRSSGTPSGSPRASSSPADRSAGRGRSGHRALLYAMGAYRLRMGEYARTGALDTWYSRITIDDLLVPAARGRRHRADPAPRRQAGQPRGAQQAHDRRRRAAPAQEPAAAPRAAPVDDQRELIDEPVPAVPPEPRARAAGAHRPLRVRRHRAQGGRRRERWYAVLGAVLRGPPAATRCSSRRRRRRLRSSSRTSAARPRSTTASASCRARS